ncbi:hypothetical protein ABID22_003120 [Pontibacter aydingkolensis]|uniref:DUF5683 domain-containing protein n=1 Tax=Pontibacter aydingkolensis TaxID=1911536 RepID=A0ABS7CXQ3_9BACT|nr:DUF5683 domain-containing protein [Pontibacter aydingkolensis]MBW7468624.1 hypothetical protein [Pontibacter aydingkolensis]
MKLRFGAAAFLLSILSYFSPAITMGQVVTAGQDSIPVAVAVPDTAQKRFFLSTWDKPAKAAFYSAIIPGAGQVYNKAYWKVPIVYATGAVLGYFLIDNNKNYQDFRLALNQRSRNETDKYVNSPIYGVYNPQNGVLTQRGTENLRYSRDFYRRNRDLTILLSVLAYGLNIAEAYVHAHLKDFDVSEDISLQVQPNLIPMRGSSYSMAPGVTLVLYSK